MDTPTLRFTFIPSILCPGTGQKTSYVPFLKVTVSFAVCPGARFLVCGLLSPGPVISRACVTWPLFFVTNV